MMMTQEDQLSVDYYLFYIDVVIIDYLTRSARRRYVDSIFFFYFVIDRLQKYIVVRV